MIQYNTVDV